MTVKYKVLEKLENGTCISGQELANELNVSRNSVWKAINSLRQDGYEISGQTNLGYKLLSFGDVFTKTSIQSFLKTNNLDLHVYETIGSTNTQLKAWANQSYSEGTIIVAKEQTAGKGRLGRSFESPNNTGVYISILLRPKFSAEQSLFITTAAAVAVAESIDKLSNEKAQIKWVNDIFVRDKKVCGILTEASINFETGGLDYAVLGIGINITNPQNGFSKEIQNIAGGIYESAPPAQIRSKITALVIDEFFKIYQQLPDNSFIDRYRERSYLNGKKVTMNVGVTQKTGIVRDIDENARLIVELDTGETQAFSAGEAMIQKNNT